MGHELNRLLAQSPFSLDVLNQEHHPLLGAPPASNTQGDENYGQAIYTWYTGGDDRGRALNLCEITRKLTEMRIPTHADNNTIDLRIKKRRRGVWHPGSVYRMLNNETYAGAWYHGKKSRDQNGQWVFNPEDEWLRVEVPAILSREVLKAAQARLQENRCRPSIHRSAN